MPEKEKKEKELSKTLVKDKEIEKMFDAKLHFGHKRTKKHAKMQPFIYGTRNGIDIIDLLETKKYIKEALDFLKEAKKKDYLILFVGTKAPAKRLLRELAEKNDMPYVSERWIGGTLTNFEIISSRVKYLKETQEKIEKKEFEKYKKKERIKIDKEMAKIERKIGGLKKLSRIPDLMFIVDIEEEKIAVKEAKTKKIPIIGICDTNGDPRLADYPILANDESISSLKYIFNKAEEALSGKEEKKVEKSEEKAEEKK